MKNYKLMLFSFFTLSVQMIVGQKQDCEEYVFYKKGIAQTLKKAQDTVVVRLNNAPNLTFIADWKEQGLINSKEKRRIELAFEKSSDIPLCVKTKTFLDSLNTIERTTKNNSYTKRIFSKAVIISKSRAILFANLYQKVKRIPLEERQLAVIWQFSFLMNPKIGK